MTGAESRRRERGRLSQMRVKWEMFGENYREFERDNLSWVRRVAWKSTGYKVKQYKLMKK